MKMKQHYRMALLPLLSLTMGASLFACKAAPVFETTTSATATGEVTPTSDSTLTAELPPASVGTVDMGTAAPLLPDLNRASAPSWVHTGLRITYAASSATVPGDGMDWEPTPDGYMVSKDGRLWNGSDRQGTAGAGYAQFDVSALTSNSAAVEVSLYTSVGLGSPLLMSQTALVGAPGATGGIWINPAMLKQLPDQTRDGLKVVRMPYTLSGKARPAVWIQSRTGKGYEIDIYEEATGLLLHMASSVTGAPPKAQADFEPSNTANTTLSSSTLVSVRRVDLPWLMENAVNWSESATPLEYSGTLATEVPGVIPLTLSQSLSAQPIAHGTGWVRYAMSATTGSINGMPPTAQQWETVSGLGQIGGLWLPPTALAKLQAGQQLDNDTVTGFRTTVDGVRRGPGGSEMLVITASSSAQHIHCGYDLHSGLLTFFDKTDDMQRAVMHTLLSLKSAH